MDNKDRFLLESLYESIYLKEENEAPEEADYDQATHSGVPYDPSVHGDLPRGNESDEEENNSDLSEDVPDGGVKIDKDTPLSYFKDGEVKNVIVKIHPNEIVKLYFDGEKFTHAVALDIRRGGDGVKNDTKVTISGLNSAFNRLKTDKSPFYNNISTVISWASADRENFGGEDDHIDATYEDRYSQYESTKIPHGIQSINESHTIKAKVVRKVETDEFVVKVYIDGKYDEEASYYTNDKSDAFHTKKAILKSFQEQGYIVEESTITESKKKVNPWAVEKSIENKTGKKFGKKHKEEIIKGIKKSAKKSGKKITSEPVKSKKKVVKEGMYDPVNDITNLPAMWALASAAGVAGLVAYLKSLKNDAIESLKENPNFIKALEKLKASQEQINAAKSSGDRETEVSQSKLHETIVQNLKGLLRDLPRLMRQSVVKKALKDSGI
jgi:hypothetical protein